MDLFFRRRSRLGGWRCLPILTGARWGIMIPRLRASVICPHSLEHSKLEFSGPSQGDGLVASPGFINPIGALLPMAPWGRTSLYSLS
jgi:hypothetical protein